MKYNDAYTIAFEVRNQPENIEDVNPQDLIDALQKRVADLQADFNNGGLEIVEACGYPFDRMDEEYS